MRRRKCSHTPGWETSLRTFGRKSDNKMVFFDCYICIQVWQTDFSRSVHAVRLTFSEAFSWECEIEHWFLETSYESRDRARVTPIIRVNL